MFRQTLPRLVTLLRPYFILTVLGMVLLLPLSGAAIPCTDDGQLYYYQTATLHYQIGEGLFFSRWLPDAGLGYGLPFFNYREPLPRYLLLVPVIFGMPVPNALNIVSGGLIILTGWGSYQLTCDVFNDERAGLVAGVAGMTAPYVLIDIYQRGNLPESVALALIPWVLWAFWQTAHSQRRALTMLFAAGLWTTLLLSHNISVLLFTPFLFLYVALLWLAQRDGDAPLRTGPVLAFVDGLGLSAFYWLPAVFETELVQLGQAISSENNRYDRNFLIVTEALGPSAPHNPLWLNPQLDIRLGLVLLTLAVIGLCVGWFAYRSWEQRATVLLFGVSAAIYLLFVFPISQPIWDVVPLLPFVQFPWRLVGRAALLLAPLAGVAVSGTLTLFEQRWADANLNWLGVLLISWASLMLLGEGLTHTYPEYCFNDPYPTINDVHAFEQDQLIGLDNEASYFPIGVVPLRDSPLLTDYQNNQQPQRFDPTQVPSTAVVVITYRPLGANISVNAPEAFTARYLVYDFPGWQAHINDQLVDSQPDMNGLLTFDVPEGESRIRVRFSPTPFRWLTIAVSAVSLLGLLVDVYPTFEFKPMAKGQTKAKSAQNNMIWLTLLILGGSLFAVRLLLPEQTTLPWQIQQQPKPVEPIGVVFNGQVQLIGIDGIDDPAASNDELRVDSYWRRVAPMPEIDTGVAWRLLGAQGVNWATGDGGIPRGTNDPTLPTHAWPDGSFASDSQLVRTIPGTPADSYTLALTLFEQSSFTPLLTEVNGVQQSAYPVKQVTVTWPDTPPTIDALGIQYPTSIDLPSNLKLLGHNLDRQDLLPGETLLLTLYWETATTQNAYPEASLTVGEATIPLIMPTYAEPIPAGARWRTQHFIQIPAIMAGGEVTLMLMANNSGVELSPISVEAVQRVFEVPPTSYTLATIFEGDSSEAIARLEGFNVEQNGDSLTVSLIWSTLKTIPDSKTVFIHALDAEGQIIAQSDTVPSRGMRPTFTWAEGEVILDTHTLTLDPEAVVSLRVGLYDTSTGATLPAQTADGTVTVPFE